MEISQVAHLHFKSYYNVDGNFSVNDQIKVIMEFPKLSTDVEGDDIFMSIPLLELKGIIMASARSKIPGPNEWTMELFLDCFEVMGAGLLKAVEESKVNGVIS